jgi:hypothetical protein
MTSSDQDTKRKPSSEQIEAAIEGTREMVETRPEPDTIHGPVDRGGGGGSSGGGGTAQGGGTSTAGPFDDSTSPADETGGPRGSGYPPSQTSGGRLDPDGDPRGVEPDEAIKRETAVFEPGTHGRKPSRSSEEDVAPERD